MSAHRLKVEEDQDGWWWLLCSCGHQAGPFLTRCDAELERDEDEGGGVS